MPGKALRTALVRSDVLTESESLRGWLALRKGRRKAGKCDKMSFLRVCLPQLNESLLLALLIDECVSDACRLVGVPRPITYNHGKVLGDFAVV